MNERPEPTPEGELIASHQKRSGLSVREAARRAGISEGWWRQIVKGYQSLSGGSYGAVKGPPETVARMAQVVGVPPSRLAEVDRGDAATFLAHLLNQQEQALKSSGAKDWRDRIREIEDLSPAEQRLAIGTIEALRRERDADHDSRQRGSA